MSEARPFGGAWGLALLTTVGCASGTQTTVAAAASLRAVMPTLVADFRVEHPDADVVVTYGASGSLRQQVMAGAPVDVVVLASRAPVTALVDAGLVPVGSVRRVATNSLVLIAPEGGAGDWTFGSLSSLPDGAHLAIGAPGAVPAGQYAVDALTALGAWPAVAPHVVYGGDVSMVLAYARRGEVAAAIVYGTDVVALGDNASVRTLDVASGSWAPVPEVVAARVGHPDTVADAFLASLSAARGQATLRASGFGAP